jgi:hypothetical protein
MPRRQTTFAILAAAVVVAGCGSAPTDSSPAGTHSTRDGASRAAAADTRDGGPAAATLDGLYGAHLDRAALRRALAGLRPPLNLPGGWWTLNIDVADNRLTISHPDEGDYTERITDVRDDEIRLAPAVACEESGAARTQPARVAWFRAGAFLRFKAIDVPCRTTAVLLTLAAWRKG